MHQHIFETGHSERFIDRVWRETAAHAVKIRRWTCFPVVGSLLQTLFFIQHKKKNLRELNKVTEQVTTSIPSTRKLFVMTYLALMRNVGNNHHAGTILKDTFAAANRSGEDKKLHIYVLITTIDKIRYNDIIASDVAPYVYSPLPLMISNWRHWGLPTDQQRMFLKSTNPWFFKEGSSANNVSGGGDLSYY